jgi:hypothetical protein
MDPPRQTSAFIGIAHKAAATIVVADVKILLTSYWSYGRSVAVLATRHRAPATIVRTLTGPARIR